MSSNNKTELPGACFFKISIAGVIQTEPIDIQLFTKDCPKTCRNFLALVSSEKTTSRQSPCPSYRGCYFHRLLEGFMVQAGDFERFDGTGGYSPIYNNYPGSSSGKFPDENLTINHDQAGLVSMANAGKNTNGSQFFITLKATPHLDGKHVVFGKVVSGMETVMAMLMVEREGDRPVSLQRVTICDCGIGTGNTSKKKRSSDASSASEHHQQQQQQQASEQPHRKKKHRKKRRRKEPSAKSDDDGSISSSSSSEEERHRKKRKNRSREYSRSDDDESSYKRKRKKKKRDRKEHRHQRKSREHWSSR
jgi:peptidyl-prolyl isomerase G (cyclophilin G)